MNVASSHRSAVGKIAVRFALSIFFFAFCVSAQAQQSAKKVSRIGILGGRSLSSEMQNVEAFRQALRELGYVETKNIFIEYRYGEGKPERLANLATELLGLNVDSMVTGSTIGAVAAKKLSATVPIILAGVSDPVGLGLVASFARPGGNVTGVTSLSPELSGKQLELFKQAFPLSRVAVLFNGANPNNVSSVKQIEAAARALRLEVQRLDVRGPDDYEPAFDAAVREHVNGLLVIREALNSTNLTRIVELASKSKLPAMYPLAENANAGGLMSYGVSSSYQWRRAASYVDRILKGSKPADLPVEQPTKFEFVINLRAAKQIGVTIPSNVLALADRVIR